MINSYVYSFIHIAICCIVAFGIKQHWRNKEIIIAGKAIAIYLIYEIVLLTPKEMNLYIGNYNWFGKIAGALFLIVSIPIFKLDYSKCNLSFRLSGFPKKTIVLGILLIVGFSLPSYLFGTYSNLVTKETLIFQATIPGIDEEIYYRGIMLSLLNGVFLKPFRFWDIEFGFGLIISSLLFGLIHGLMPCQFSMLYFAKTAIFGFVMGLIVENSKNILIPIGLHNLSNVSICLLH